MAVSGADRAAESCWVGQTINLTLPQVVSIVVMGTLCFESPRHRHLKHHVICLSTRLIPSCHLSQHTSHPSRRSPPQHTTHPSRTSDSSHTTHPSPYLLLTAPRAPFAVPPLAPPLVALPSSPHAASSPNHLCHPSPCITSRTLALTLTLTLTLSHPHPHLPFSCSMTSRPAASEQTGR